MGINPTDPIRECISIVHEDATHLNRMSNRRAAMSEQASHQYEVMRFRLENASEFIVCSESIVNGFRFGGITIKRRDQEDGRTLWGVYRGEQSVWHTGADGWVMEPMPSGRTPEYLAATRFELDEAWKIALKAVPASIQPPPEGV